MPPENNPALTVYDIGAHKGEDTDFYLRKGFRVVGVEADPDLAKNLKLKFAAEIAADRFILVQKAIAERSGEKITFYTNPDNSVWGTTNKAWVERNREHYGTSNLPIEVETITLHDLIAQCGKPYYIKIDIEGSDMLCLQQVGQLDDVQKPNYISIESSLISMEEIEQELSLFKKLGYDSFKVVAQHDVHYQKPPYPAKEGVYVNQKPMRDSSGHFGEEAPGKWLNYEDTLKRYQRVFWFYAMNGVNGILNRWAPAKWRGMVMKIFGRLGFRAGWYDTHARLKERS